MTKCPTIDELMLGKNPSAADLEHMQNLCVQSLRVSPGGRELMTRLANAVPPMVSGFQYSTDPAVAAFMEGARSVVAMLYRWSETPVTTQTNTKPK